MDDHHEPFRIHAVEPIRMLRGSRSWFRLRHAVRELFPFEHVIPTDRGRAAEKILFSALGGPRRTIPNKRSTTSARSPSTTATSPG